jgi:hypothetical protein
MTITLTREEVQQVLDCLAFSNLKEADAAAKTLRTRLAQPEEKLLTQEQAIDVAQKLFDSAMLCSLPPSGTTWQNAALRLGEELSTVGPDGYYNMTAQQWLDWAMENVTPARISQPEPEPVIKMKELLEVQGRDGNWNLDQYMQGMYNGMELMVALAEGRDPVFRKAPENWLSTPPQREWQGLTENEKELLWDEAVEGREHFCSQYGNFADALEAKLREKNL